MAAVCFPLIRMANVTNQQWNLFGFDGGEAVGGFVGVVGAATFRRVMLPTRSVRVIDCPAGA